MCEECNAVWSNGELSILMRVAEEAEARGEAKGRREALEEAIKLSDKIEMSEPDGGTREWMAFKHFRNTLRDSLTS